MHYPEKQILFLMFVFLPIPIMIATLKILTDTYIAVGKSVATKGRFGVFLIAREAS
jgi:hypothetical protein